MASKLTDLENQLDKTFGKNAPQLPKNGKDMLIQWTPVVAAVIGVLSRWAAWNLWHWAHLAERVIGGICNAYTVAGCGAYVSSRFSLWLWASILLLGVEGVLYLLAYPGLQARKKQGWNYLFYGALLNVVYAIVSLFAGYNATSSFVGALVGSAVGFYFLFQIRGAYTGNKAPVSKDSK